LAGKLVGKDNFLRLCRTTIVYYTEILSFVGQKRGKFSVIFAKKFTENPFYIVS
jgi:hypothetical protein